MDWIVSQGIMGALPLLIVAFAILVKCADWMVEGAVDKAIGGTPIFYTGR